MLGPRMAGRRTTRGGGSLKVRTWEHGVRGRRNHLGDCAGVRVSHIGGSDKTRDDVEGVRGPQRITDKGAKKSKRLVLLKLRGCFVSSVHVPLHEVNPRIIMKVRSDAFEARRGGGGRHVKCGGGGERWQGTVTHTRQVG